MYKTEQETMLNADTIFKNVLNYIIEELKKCETRTVCSDYIIIC